MNNNLNFAFEYSKSMREYREKENVKNEIKNIEISSLKSEMPYFTFDLEAESGSYRQKIRTKKISGNEFQVLDGYGQFSYGIFILQNECENDEKITDFEFKGDEIVNVKIGGDWFTAESVFVDVLDISGDLHAAAFREVFVINHFSDIDIDEYDDIADEVEDIVDDYYDNSKINDFKEFIEDGYDKTTIKQKLRGQFEEEYDAARNDAAYIIDRLNGFYEKNDRDEWEHS